MSFFGFRDTDKKYKDRQLIKTVGLEIIFVL